MLRVSAVRFWIMHNNVVSSGILFIFIVSYGICYVDKCLCFLSHE